MEMAWKA